jgi:hypothetical protein
MLEIMLPSVPLFAPHGYVLLCAYVTVQLLDHAKHVRYMMLRGAGTHFSGGVDLKGM